MNVGPLYGLRLSTPRLELRLGSREELVELAHLAEEGIHPPEEMPFAVPWTDGIGSPGFVEEFLAFHEGQLTAWTTEEWHLALLVWAEGSLAGTQSMRGTAFTGGRIVDTGSWLGARFQRRGYGTEMRAAVLELAFRGLGAIAATSGFMEGNIASARVSQRLGYREVGVGERAPRGIPVREHEVRLDGTDWRSPVPVDISGLEPALPLFGVA